MSPATRPGLTTAAGLARAGADARGPDRPPQPRGRPVPAVRHRVGGPPRRLPDPGAALLRRARRAPSTSWWPRSTSSSTSATGASLLLVTTKSIAVVFLVLASRSLDAVPWVVPLSGRRRRAHGPGGARSCAAREARPPRAGSAETALTSPLAGVPWPSRRLPGGRLRAPRAARPAGARAPRAPRPAGGRFEVEYAGEPVEVVRAASGGRPRAACCARTSAAACSGSAAKQRYRCPCHEGVFDGTAARWPGRRCGPWRRAGARRGRRRDASSASDERSPPGRDRRLRLRRAPPARGPEAGLPHRRPGPPLAGALRRAGAPQHHVAPGRHRRPGRARADLRRDPPRTAGPTS